MTKLQQRLYLHWQRRERRKVLVIRFKKGCMKTAAIFVTVVMFSSIVRLPLVCAYFTAKGESEILTFVVKATCKTKADISFLDDFLFDNNANKKETEGALEQRSGLLGSLSKGTLEALAGIDGIDADSLVGKPPREKLVRAEIRLEDGFDVEEIHIPSIEIHYRGFSAPALSGELGGDGVLTVDFERGVLAGWFEKTEEKMEHAVFTVTGEGYDGGLDHFLFSGEAQLLLKGSYGVRNVEISGPDDLFIPLPGETFGEVYSLISQEGIKLDGARWALKETVEGVELDVEKGLLSIYPSAAQKPVDILAMLELDGRILIAQKAVNLYAQPQPNLIGAEKITIPLPQENVQEQYRVETWTDLELKQVNWELLGGGRGISVDEKGLVTVSGDTDQERFTLQALVKIGAGSLVLDIDLIKEVLLEAIEIGAIDILGETQIAIPEDQPCTGLYRAVVYDPEGNALQGEPVTWDLEQGGYGISLDPENGLLTVENSASSGDITLVATSVRSAAIQGHKTVSLEAGSQGTEAPAPKAEETRSLIIEGQKLILIPAEGTRDYFYQATTPGGNPLGSVFFELLEEYEGVTLNDDGRLTILANAGEGSVLLQATLQGSGEKEGDPLTGQLMVRIALPPPTAIQIEGENDEENPPGKEEEPLVLDKPPGDDSGNDGDDGYGGNDSSEEIMPGEEGSSGPSEGEVENAGVGDNGDPGDLVPVEGATNGEGDKNGKEDEQPDDDLSWEGIAANINLSEEHSETEARDPNEKDAGPAE